MIHLSTVKQFCNDYPMIENYDKAISDNACWVCHHRKGVLFSKEDLISRGEYYGVAPSDLIFVTKSEHSRIHNAHRREETIKKVSFTRKNSKAVREHLLRICFKVGNVPYNYGKPLSVFGSKFFEHFGLTRKDDKVLYNREYAWYMNHGYTCRWEVI